MPESVRWLLLIQCVVALGVVGYGSGLARGRALFAMGSLSSLVALVLMVIVDLDRPGRGLIQVGQRSMVSLRHDLARERP